jgi:hypothetical protein
MDKPADIVVRQVLLSARSAPAEKAGFPGPAVPVMINARSSGSKLTVLSAEPNAESSSKLKQFIASGRVPKPVYLVSRRDSKTCLGRLAEPM